MTNRTDKLLALYSRVAWLPLYYPETIYALVKGENLKIDPTKFNYPLNGYMGYLAETLYNRSKELGLRHYDEKIISFKEINDGFIKVVIQKLF